MAILGWRMEAGRGEVRGRVCIEDVEGGQVVNC